MLKTGARFCDLCPPVLPLPSHVMYSMCMYLCITELAEGLGSASLCSVARNGHPSCRNPCRNCMCMRCSARLWPALARSRGALRACRSAHVGERFVYLLPLYEAISYGCVGGSRVYFGRQSVNLQRNLELRKTWGLWRKVKPNNPG